MQKLEPTMTRTAFCKSCKEAGYPRKHTAYAVYAGNHKSYNLCLHVGNISARDLGMTPHVFFDADMVVPINGKRGGHYCVTKCLCGVIGCGFKIKWEKGYKIWSLLTTHEPDFTYIRGESMDALKDFKASEMHLNTTDTRPWKIQEIIQEQQSIFKGLRRS